MGTQTNFLLLFCYRPGALPCTCLFCSLHLLWWGAWKNAPHTRHKMSQLMIHESLLFRFKSLEIIASHTSTVPRQPGLSTNAMHRERIDKENREIKIVMREHQNSPRPRDPPSFSVVGSLKVVQVRGQIDWLRTAQFYRVTYLLCTDLTD